MCLETPLQIFRYFFSDDLIEHIVFESNRYSKQVDTNNKFSITGDDIKTFLGICTIMSVVHVSDVRKYWSPNIGNDIIQNTMCCNDFEKIRSLLHFSDNYSMLPKDHPGHDRLYKIRPVVETLKNKFSSIPLEESLSIDEQLCSTKARHYLKQYMPMKPHKWGYKLFVLSGVSGFSYNFEIFTGQENNDENRPSFEPDLGAAANVVVRFSRVAPKNQNYKIYFDNYYTTILLLVYLKSRGILSLGTARRNRLCNVLLPHEKEMLKKPRGAYMIVV